MVPPHAVHAPAFTRVARRHTSAVAGQDELSALEGESGFSNQRLTSSVHISRVVKSERKPSEAELGAVPGRSNRGTRKNPEDSEILVRLWCS